MILGAEPRVHRVVRLLDLGSEADLDLTEVSDFADPRDDRDRRAPFVAWQAASSYVELTDDDYADEALAASDSM